MIKESEFTAYLLQNLGSSKSTINAYISDIKDFCSYLEKNRTEIPCCTADDIKLFLIMLKDEGKSGSTINRKMVSLRKYFEFLRINGLIELNPCTKIKVPKVEYKDPEFLSVEQIESLLAQPDDSDLGQRDSAILELLYACGLKAGELADLNVQDVDMRIGFVSCRGESSKNRIVPMGHPARMALMEYMKSSRNKLLSARGGSDSTNETPALFLNYTGQRISRQGVWKLVKYYGKKAGISDNLNPQLIRNSFAAHMIMNGADLKSLQQLLGNEDASTTKMFMSLSKNRVMDVYDKTHPRA